MKLNNKGDNTTNFNKSLVFKQREHSRNYIMRALISLVTLVAVLASIADTNDMIDGKYSDIGTTRLLVVNLFIN